MKVLIIDDSDLARVEMERVLVRAGYEVFSAASPIGTTRIIVSKRIDVVLLDVNLPSMSGDKLLQLFRRNPRLRELVVVLTSGMPSKELQRIAEACNADGSVTKQDLDTGLHQAIVAARASRWAALRDGRQ
jgi:CheY-like chemotaxis protein